MPFKFSQFHMPGKPDFLAIKSARFSAFCFYSAGHWSSSLASVVAMTL